MIYRIFQRYKYKMGFIQRMDVTIYFCVIYITLKSYHCGRVYCYSRINTLSENIPRAVDEISVLYFKDFHCCRLRFTGWLYKWSSKRCFILHVFIVKETKRISKYQSFQFRVEAQYYLEMISSLDSKIYLPVWNNWSMQYTL